jgi:hypothetical protein
MHVEVYSFAARLSMTDFDVAPRDQPSAGGRDHFYVGCRYAGKVARRRVMAV